MADKPSAWALRTAIALMRDAGGAQLRNVSDLELLARPITHKVASTIDRETGVLELLNVAKAIHAFLWKERGQTVGMADLELSEVLKKAIDKVEK